jgi:hypothetical protein
MNVRVRDAGVDDSEALAAIQVDSYRIAYAGLLLPKEYLDCFSYEEQAHDWRTLLAAPRDDLLCSRRPTRARSSAMGLRGPVRPRLRPTTANWWLCTSAARVSIAAWAGS